MLTYASWTRTASLAWTAYHAPLLAGAAALLLVLLARASARAALAAVAAPLAVAIGWAAVLLPAGWRIVLQPRTTAEHLALPALAAVALAVLLPYARGRWGTVLPVLLAVGAGWWLAGSPAGRPEFWRVWVVVAVLAWGLARLAGADAARVAAAALALWGALLAVGAPMPWQAVASVASVAAAAAMALLAGRPSLSVAPLAVLVAAAAAAASLGAGRLARGQFGAVDAACAAAFAAPLLVPVLARRMGRAGCLAPVLAAAVAAALAWALAWITARIVPLR